MDVRSKTQLAFGFLDGASKGLCGIAHAEDLTFSEVVVREVLAQTA